MRFPQSLQFAVALLIAGGTLNLKAQMSPPSTSPALTFEDALKRARSINPELSAALVEQQVVHEDQVQARAALLPSASYNAQYLYTQGNGTRTNAPVFVANNAVHEYISQADVHEDLNLGAGQIANIRRTLWTEARAKTKAEIARRGLFLLVAKNYFGLIRSQHDYSAAQRASVEAKKFLSLSQALENGGEVAHSDVIKAQLQSNDRTRDLREAQLAMENGRINLAVLVFRTFTEDFHVVEEDNIPALPNFDEARHLAEQSNLDVRTAMAALSAAQADVSIARSTYFPTLSIDYLYGFDATHFALSTDGVSNLGYVVQATLDIPIWEWGAQLRKVHQAELQRAQASVELSFAQRLSLANLNSFYLEAEAARSQLQSLRESLTLTEDSLRLTTLRYQSGEAKVIDVVDAQNTLTLTQNAYEDSMLRYRVAVAQLQTITGGF